MGDIVEIGASIFQMSQRRLETVSQNVANVQTPGYQSFTSFQTELTAQADAVSSVFSASPAMTSLLQESRSFDQGELKLSGNAMDFALSGEGLFAVREVGEVQNSFTLTRNGRFEVNSGGFVTDAFGRRLQTADRQDLKISSMDITVAADGMIFENEQPIDKIGIFTPSKQEGALPELTQNLDEAAFELRQGMIEASNVSLPSEMIEMMAAVRQAETGSRILQTYDTLMGQAISSFGQR